MSIRDRISCGGDNKNKSKKSISPCSRFSSTKTNLMADARTVENELDCDDSTGYHMGMAVHQAKDHRNLVNGNRCHLDAPFRCDELDFVCEFYNSILNNNYKFDFWEFASYL